MCTAYSKENFSDLFQLMKSMTEHKTFSMTFEYSTLIKTVDSIFADTVCIYESEVLLDIWHSK